MDKVDIKYQLNKKDLVAMHRNDFLVYQRSKYSLMKKLVFCLLVCVYITVLGIWDINYLFTPILILLGYFLLMFLFRFFGISGQVDRQMRTGQYFTDEYRRIFTPEGIIRLNDEGEEYLTDWSEVYSVKEKKNYFYMVVTEIEYSWVPKTAFKNEEELAFARECFSKAGKGGNQNG